MNSQVLWAGTVRSRPIRERSEVATAGGFGELSLFPTDVREWVKRGNTPDDLLTLSGRHNVDVTVLDPYTKWVPE
jgi:hypothetical protein